MDYEETADIDKLLVFMLKNTIRNQSDQDILGGIFSKVKESGWNKGLLDELREHIKTLVPEGDYCYLSDVCCPFWDKDDEKDEQEAGYCHLLQHGDWEFNDSKIYINCRTGDKQTANEIGIPLSLLWDQCKECNINPYTGLGD